MKKIAILSHCVLNSCCELPEAPDTFRRQILETLLEKNISIFQLPCPELCFQALERESILPESSLAKDYRDYCKTLLAPVIKNLEEYKKHDIEVALIMGIDTSPSCSVHDREAIMMKLLLESMKKINIQWGQAFDMPVDGTGEAFLERLKEI